MLRPARRGRLAWHAPAGAVDFAKTRAELERIVSVPHENEIYSANRRSIYLVDDEALGRLAVKEMRHAGAARRFWFRTVRLDDALRELRVGSEFAARGGRTPEVFGAALEGTPITLERVLLFVRWLDDAPTLTDFLRKHGDPPSPALFDALAKALVDAAQLGLVHGRHSSENVLVATESGAPVFYTIDFSHARLAERLDDEGLTRDAARIAHWLWHEKVCSDATLAELFRSIAGRAWPHPSRADERARAMARELERLKRALHKSPEERARRERRPAEPAT